MVIKRILRKIFQKSRLNYYQEILQKAIDKGYIVTSLEDWYKNNFYQDQKVLILRHDVDLFPGTAKQMFLIEKKLGVKSTYFFRWLTIDSLLIKQMRKDGFEVSLHYETIATYAKKNRIFNAEELSETDFSKCLEILKNEIIKFENEYGKIKTLCSHGDIRNRKLGVPNHKLLENVKREDLGIFFETYDKDILSRFDTYISDSSFNDNHEWKYGKSPEHAIESGAMSICLLTHPHHWYYSFRLNTTKLFLEIIKRT